MHSTFASRITRSLAALACASALALTVTPAQAQTFADVEPGAWYEDGVTWCADHGLIAGYPDGSFGVGDTLTIEQLATILWRVAEPEAAASYDPATAVDTTGWADVEDHAWYTGAVSWAKDAHVINGYGKLGTHTPVTAERLVTVLRNLAGWEAVDHGVLAGYADAADVDEWASDGMAWAVTEGLVHGYPDGTLRPQEPITRARAATILASAGRQGLLDTPTAVEAA